VSPTISGVPKSILRIHSAFVELEPDPIPAEWILEGNPQARANKLVTTRDWSSTVVVWDCTPGSFKWHYSKDETVNFLSGEAFMIDASGEDYASAQAISLSSPPERGALPNTLGRWLSSGKPYGAHWDLF